MADTRNIVIELRLSQGESSDSEVSKDKESGKINLSDLLHPMRTVTKQVFGNKAGLVMKFTSSAKSTIMSAAKYEINKYLSLSENYTLQQDLNNTLTAISKMTSFSGAIIGGAITGSAAGPVGAIAGAIIGTVSFASNEAVQIYQRFDQQNRMLAGANVQSNFQFTRMGLTDGGRNSLN